MARGGARVGAGRPKGSNPRKRALPRSVTAGSASVKLGATADAKTPLAYMLAVIHDEAADAGRRDRMAVAAAPYLHPKMGEGGKKDGKQKGAAAAAAGKFSPAAPPKLAAANGKIVNG